MANYKTIALLLAGTALTVLSVSSVAVADPINPLFGTTADSTLTYLSTHAGVAGPADYITYSINMPSTTCSGASFACGNDPGPSSIVGGYNGSVDQSWQQLTGAYLQTLVWGTTNGNENPAQADVLYASGYPFDGVGNTPAVNSGSLLSWGGFYDNGGAGTWDGLTPFIGVNSSTADDGQSDTVYLVFSQPIAGFSALFSFNPAGGTGLVQGLDNTGVQIDGNYADINDGADGVNGGIMLGFLNTTNDIYVIALSNAYSVMTNISITYLEQSNPPTEVPEPITLALLGSGLLGLGVARRYRAK